MNVSAENLPPICGGPDDCDEPGVYEVDLDAALLGSSGGARPVLCVGHAAHHRDLGWVTGIRQVISRD